MSGEIDLYGRAGGDAAWKLWFERCSVHRVGETDPDFAAGLAAEIDSAMYGQLPKMGLSKEAMNGDVPHLHFDSFFLADSMRADAKNRKPLKQYYKDRLATADRPLKQFVCGTIFSPNYGRVRDIARDWVCTVLGWKTHSIYGDDGNRHVIWERAAEKEDAGSLSTGVSCPACGQLEQDELKADVESVFGSLSNALGVEKRVIAVLFYTASRKISLDQPLILDTIGCKKSTAYELQDKCLDMSEKMFLEKNIATNDLMFAHVLLSICEAYDDVVTCRAVDLAGKI